MARRTTPPTTELGRQLEKERIERGLTMQGLADWIGVAKPTVIGWYRGVKPQPHHVELIAEKLDTQSGTVFGWVLVASVLYITWSDGEEAHVGAEEWFRRPIDFLAGERRLKVA